jgi:hypothetical protein
MTLPDERYRSLVETRKFLVSLLVPSITPKVPRKIREQARALLKHYPTNYFIDDLCVKLPKDYAKEMEPLYRMVKVYEQDKQDSNPQQNVNW